MVLLQLEALLIVRDSVQVPVVGTLLIEEVPDAQGNVEKGCHIIGDKANGLEEPETKDTTKGEDDEAAERDNPHPVIILLDATESVANVDTKVCNVTGHMGHANKDPLEADDHAVLDSHEEGKEADDHPSFMTEGMDAEEEHDTNADDDVAIDRFEEELSFSCNVGRKDCTKEECTHDRQEPSDILEVALDFDARLLVVSRSQNHENATQSLMNFLSASGISSLDRYLSTFICRLYFSLSLRMVLIIGVP